MNNIKIASQNLLLKLETVEYYYSKERIAELTKDVEDLCCEWRACVRFTFSISTMSEMDRERMCYLYNNRNIDSKKVVYRLFKAMRIVSSLYKLLDYDACANCQDLYVDPLINAIYCNIFNVKFFSHKPVEKRLLPMIIKHFKRGIFFAGCILGLVLKTIDDECITLIIESIGEQLENSSSSNLNKTFLIHLLTNGLHRSVHKSSQIKATIYKLVHFESMVSLLETCDQ